MDSIAGGNRQADNTVKEEHVAWKASLKQVEEPLQIRSCHLLILGAAHEVAGEDSLGVYKKNKVQMMVHRCTGSLCSCRKYISCQSTTQERMEKARHKSMFS